MGKIRKVIFVSTSDTGMGPMAKGIFKEIAKNSEIASESRGLVVLFPEPVNQKAEAILASKGIMMEGQMSVALKEEDFEEDTLILTMFEGQKETIYENFPNVSGVFTLLEYLNMEGVLLNPYGGSLSEYGQCYETLRQLLEYLYTMINKEEQTE